MPVIPTLILNEQLLARVTPEQMEKIRTGDIPCPHCHRSAVLLPNSQQCQGCGILFQIIT